MAHPPGTAASQAPAQAPARVGTPPWGRDVQRELEGLERRPMVSWFHPLELLRTGFRLAFARQIAAYFDRRELQAALHAPGAVAGAGPGAAAAPGAAAGGALPVADLSDRNEVWIDFISDVGDGWDPAYTMASLLARKELQVEGLDRPLPRADLLVLGGDQAYPAPSREAYRTRFRGPYTAALPALEPGEAEPLLVAIPGDHDWYDGLTHFLRNFGQGGRIGTWRCVQRRSYFAVRLPHGWSLWGLDVPLETRIDAPQLEHFDELARRAAGSDEARLIVCAHAPTWTYAEPRSARRKRYPGPDAHKNLAYFEERVVRANGMDLALSLAGRHHCYHRYRDERGKQRVTAGGGGAYLAGTHHLPRRIRLEEDSRTVEYVESGHSFPSRGRSRRLALGALRFPLLRVNRGFCLLLGLWYALMGWSLADGFGGWSVAVAGVVVLGFGAFARVGNLPAGGARGLGTWSWGALHGGAHAALAAALARTLPGALERIWEVGTWPHALGLYLGLVLLGGLAGGLLVGLYLVVSDRLLAWHQNEVFSCQAIPDYKSFVRMHIDARGTLTLYPIGVRRVPRRWRRRPEVEPGDAFIEPTEEAGLPRPRLIEGPIRVPRR